MRREIIVLHGLASVRKNQHSNKTPPESREAEGSSSRKRLLMPEVDV